MMGSGAGPCASSSSGGEESGPENGVASARPVSRLSTSRLAAFQASPPFARGSLRQDAWPLPLLELDPPMPRAPPPTPALGLDYASPGETVRTVRRSRHATTPQTEAPGAELEQERLLSRICGLEQLVLDLQARLRSSVEAESSELRFSTEFVALERRSLAGEAIPQTQFAASAQPASSCLIMEEQAALVRTLHEALRGRSEALSRARLEVESLRAAAQQEKRNARTAHEAAEAAREQLLEACTAVRAQYTGACGEVGRLRGALASAAADRESHSAQAEEMRHQLALERRRGAEAAAAATEATAALQALQSHHTELLRAHRAALEPAASETQEMTMAQRWPSQVYDSRLSINEPRWHPPSPPPLPPPPPMHQHPHQHPHPYPHQQHQQQHMQAQEVRVAPEAAHRAHPSNARGLELSFDPFTGGPVTVRAQPQRATQAQSEAARAYQPPPAPPPTQQQFVYDAPHAHAPYGGDGRPQAASAPMAAVRSPFSGLSESALDALVQRLCHERDALTEELRTEGPGWGRTLAARTRKAAVEARAAEVSRELASARAAARTLGRY